MQPLDGDLVLGRSHLRAAQRISPEAQHELGGHGTLTTLTDHVTGDLIAQLDRYVLARRQPPHKVMAHAEVDIPGAELPTACVNRRTASRWALAGTALTFIATYAPPHLSGALVAIFVWYTYHMLLHERFITRGTQLQPATTIISPVLVHVEPELFFPEAKIQFPPELGAVHYDVRAHAE